MAIIPKLQALGVVSSTGTKSFVQMSNALHAMTESQIANLIVTNNQTLGTEALNAQLTYRRLLEAGVSKEVARAAVTQAAQTAATNAQTTATAGATVATGGLSAAVTGLGASLKALALANPILTAITVAIAVIGATVAVVDALTVSVEEQKKKVEEATKAYEESKSELESVNAELQTAIDRIRELNSKDTLTFIEQSELDKLKETTKELELQKDILEKQAKLKAKDVVEENVKLYEKQYGDQTYSQAGVNELIANAQISGNNAILLSDTSDIEAMIAAYKQFSDLKDEALSNGNGEELEHFSGIVDDISSSLWTSAENLMKMKKAMSEIPFDEMDSKQQAVFLNIEQAIELIYQNLDPKKWKEIRFNEIFDTDEFGKIKEELLSLARSGEISEASLNSYPKLSEKIRESGLTAKDVIEQFKALASAQDEAGSFAVNYADNLKKSSDAIKGIESSMSSLSDAFAEQNENGRLSAKTILDLVDAGYAAALSIDAETGAVTLNKDAYIQLTQAKISAQMAELEAQKMDIKSRLDDERESVGRLSMAYATLGTAVAQAALSEAIANRDRDEAAYNEINAQLAVLQNLRDNINNVMTGSYGNARTSSGDAWAEAYEKEAKELKYSLDLRQITLQEYYDKMTALNEKYFAGRSKYIDQYRDNILSLESIEKEIYEKEAKELKYSLDLRQITLQEYYDKMTALNEKYFAGQSKYIDQYRDNIISLASIEKEIYDNRRKYMEHQISMLERQNGTIKEQVRLYVELLNTVEAEIQSAYAKGYTDNDDYVQSLQKQWTDYADSVIGIYDKIIDAAKSSIDFQIDDLKKEMDKATSAIQSQIDSLKQQQDNFKKANQDRIDAIDDEIDALQNKIDLLQKENDAIDEANKLLELQQKLENAKNQKNTRVYHEDQGWVWEANQSDIKDAQDAYDSALRDKARNDAIDNIRSQIDTLNAEKERLQRESENYLSDEIQSLESQLKYTGKYYNKRISQLQEYGDKWDQIQRDVKRKHNQMLLDEYNINTQESVALEERLATLADFVDRYNALISSLKTEGYKRDQGLSAGASTSLELTSIEGGYAKGTTRVPKSGNYVVNEGGLDELIASTVGGQIVNLRSADAVYPARATETLMQIGNNPLEFMSDIIPSVLDNLTSTLPMPTQGSLKPGLSDDILRRLGSIMNNMRIPASSGEIKQSRDIIFYGPVTMRTSANNLDSLARDINLYYPNRKK